MEFTRSDDLKIFYYYLGEIDFGKNISSPLPGRDDIDPSFGIYESESGRVRCKDFGGGGFNGSSIDFMIEVEDEVTNFKEAIEFYNRRIRTSGPNPFMLKTRFTSPKIKKKASFQIRPYWEDFEKGYWEDYPGFTVPFLKDEGVEPVEAMLYSDRVVDGSREGDPMFIFRFKENPDAWKTYKPLTKNKKYKWRSDSVGRVIDGWMRLPDRCSRIYISSGRKDRMAVNVAGYHSISGQSEGSYKEILRRVPLLQQKTDNIFAIYDGDMAGWEGMWRLHTESDGIIQPCYIFYPPPLEDRDMAGFLKQYGAHALKNFLDYATD